MDLEPEISSSSRFESFVAKILSAHGFQLRSAAAFDVDFIAELNNENWAVEVKFYKTTRSQMGLVESAVVQLERRGINAGADRAMLIISSVMPVSFRKELQKRHNILVADRSDLAKWCSQFPDFMDELQAILEDAHAIEVGLDGRSISAAFEADHLHYSAPPVPNTGAILAARLKRLPRGPKGWADYERLCEEILRYLFAFDLRSWHRQLRTDDGFNRYDYVCRIVPTTEFWMFLQQQVGSRYIVFEFKNYTDKIRQGQILTTEKYLMDRGLRKVAVVITRAGADPGARSIMQGAMRESGKLILALDDEKVTEMLRMRDDGEDPSDLLFDVADEFLLSLSR